MTPKVGYCKDCKWWLEHNETWKQDGLGRWLCGLPDPSWNQFPISERSDTNHGYTAPDFGCVEFEGKEGEI